MALIVGSCFANWTAAEVISTGSMVIYDFESLSAGSLAGQDGWTMFESGHNPTVTAPVVGDGNSSSKVSAGGARVFRVNGGGFSLPTLSNTGSFELYADVYPETGPVIFGLGYDANNNGTIHYGSEQGPMFGYWNNGFTIASAGPQRDTYTGFAGQAQGRAWYSLKLAVDPTAYSGDGAGTLYYKDLNPSKPDYNTSWTLVSGLSGVNLHLTQSTLPATWNALFFDSRGGSIDNIGVNVMAVPAVPEPSAVMLMGSGGLVIWRARRRLIRQK